MDCKIINFLLGFLWNPADDVAMRTDRIIADISKRTSGWSGRGERYNGAEVLGLTPVGNASYFAMAVGCHPDLPDVVIKVIDPTEDGFAVFAQAVFDGTLTGPEYPKILSITDVSDNVQVVLMERLQERRPSQYAEYSRLLDAIKRSPKYAALNTLAEDHNLYLDLHIGNIMRRGDQLVILDPLGGIRTDGDEYS